MACLSRTFFFSSNFSSALYNELYSYLVFISIPAYCVTDSKLISQYMVQDHMAAHYKKIVKAKRKDFLGHCEQYGLLTCVFIGQLIMYRSRLKLFLSSLLIDYYHCNNFSCY